MNVFRKKFPGLAGAILPPEQASDGVATGLIGAHRPSKLPGEALPSLPQTAIPNAVPSLPSPGGPPQASAPADDQIKQRALMNIARGRKGF